MNATNKLMKFWNDITYSTRVKKDRWATNFMQWWLQFTNLLKRTSSWFSVISISIFAVGTAVSILYFSNLRHSIDLVGSTDSIMTSLGATFGTILALVLTLSFIPIQRAAEAWSPSILRLYRQDLPTYVTFIVLSLFCIASFLLAVVGLSDFSTSIIVASAIAALGISLDVLRWYHSHVSKLLDPAYAVSLITKKAYQSVDKVQKEVTRVAKVQYRLISTDESNNISLEDIETALYPHVPGYPMVINSWVHDASEIAGKAIARGEKSLARVSIGAISLIINYFLLARRNNLVLVPSAEALFLASDSDVKLVTNPAYDLLNEICMTAISKGDESSGIRVIEAYENIAVHTANLQARNFRSYSAPLTYAPIFYLLLCVKSAQEKDFKELPFQSAGILARIAKNTPKNITLTDVHIPIVDGIYDITARFYLKKEGAFADQVVGNMMTVVDDIIDREGDYFRELLRHVLEKLEALAPLALLNEQLQSRLTLAHPLGKAYGLTNPQSLGYLYEKATRLVKVDPERDWISPYFELLKITEIYYRHFRNLGEQCEFGESFLLWDLTYLIKHIVLVVEQLVSNPIRPDHGDEEKLIKKLQWILSFFWVAFDKKKTVDKQRADDACEVLTYTGLLFLDLGYPKILKAVVSYIKSIIDSYCRTVTTSNAYVEYDLGDLFAHLWTLRHLAINRNVDYLIKEIDSALEVKPVALTEENWQNSQEAIKLRRQQLDDRLAEGPGRIMGRETSEELLLRLLQV